MSKRLDLVGQKFGRLTVIEFSHIDKVTFWKCKCDCGKYHIVAGYLLVKNKVKSCGCLRFVGFNRIHGMSTTKFYQTWYNMKKRCFNKKDKSYNCYGGRGITVCNRWLKFENFRDDMYQSYLTHIEQFGKKDTTIDRNDNNNDYCPQNCFWKTHEEQGANKRNNYFLTYKGKNLPLIKLFKKLNTSKLNISYSLLRERIDKLNWPIEKALITPARFKNKNILLTFNEQTKTITEWGKEFNLNNQILRNRIVNFHWTTEKALNTPVKFYKKRTKSS